MSSSGRVIVAGAGPVGLLVALALGEQGVPVVVLEATAALTHDLRAGTFHPPSLEMMAPYGITDEMHRTGLPVRHWQLRDRQEGLIAQWDLDLLRDETPYPYRLHLEQHRLTPILYDKASRLPQVEVRFASPVVDVGQDADRAWAVVETPAGRKRIEGKWLVGCDGGRSAVRRRLGVEMEGFTWPERFVVVSTGYDFAQHGITPNAYVADPEQWAALFKMPDEGGAGLWRVAFPVPPDEADETTLSEGEVERRMQYFVPRPERYAIRYKSIYKVHQRVAKAFRRGRILLAGDAAHLNNPLGAFGLNGGIHDAINLAGKLGPVCRGKADATLLDRYERQRRTVNIEYVQDGSIRNLKTLAERDPDARRRRFDELRRINADPVQAREFLLQSSMIASVRRERAID
ncbi:MAG TPA: FAD-dependent monooxygenase [Burkholderiales bacterium]|nr:FAD-dependent monooxygenase [Burkholderiales bacterium]